jgi:hypothetical protein
MEYTLQQKQEALMCAEQDLKNTMDEFNFE